MSTNHAAAASGKPRWEAWMDEEILPVTDPVMSGDAVKLLEIIRTLLRAPETDDDTQAAQHAVEDFQTYFHDAYLDEGSGAGWYLRHMDGNGSGITESIVLYSWEMAAFFPADGVKHRQLAEFVDGFKKQAPVAFDPKDPVLPFDSGIAGTTARRCWEEFKVNSPSPDQTEDEYHDSCTSWLNAAGFVARLLDLDVLGDSELTLLFRDLKDGLEQPSLSPDADRNTVLFWQCQAAVAAQHISMIGHIIVEEVEQSTSTERVHLGPGTWKTWAVTLEKIAETDIGGVDEWDLKKQAKIAHEKMVQLWPDAFEAE